MFRSLPVLTAVVLGMSTPAIAQRALPGQQPSQAPAASGPEQRAAQLRSVVGRVTSPDRNLNIANLEEIAASGDTVAIELAVRALMEGEDPVMRGMAMRAYVTAARALILEVLLPQDQLRLVQQARSSPNGFRDLSPQHAMLARLASSNFQVRLRFEPGSIREIRGVLMDENGSRQEYVVRGERVTARVAGFGSTNNCEAELRPGRGATIAATFNCQGFNAPVQLEAPMF